MKKLFLSMIIIVFSLNLNGMNDLTQKTNQEKLNSFIKEHQHYIKEVPQEIKKAVIELYQNNKEYFDMSVNLNTIVQEENNNALGDWFKEKQNKTEELKNLSACAHTIPICIDNKTVAVVRIGGALHAREDVRTQNNTKLENKDHKPYGTKLSSKEVEVYIEEHGNYSVQNITHFINQATLAKIITEEGLKEFEPLTINGLVQFDENDQLVSDQTSCVVQQFIANSKPIGEVMHKLNSNHIKAIYTLNKKSGGLLWGIDSNSNGQVIHLTEDGKLKISDAQQPNTTAITEFLNTPNDRIWHNRLAGMEGLYILSEKNKRNDLASLILELVSDDVTLACKETGKKLTSLNEYFSKKITVLDN